MISCIESWYLMCFYLDNRIVSAIPCIGWSEARRRRLASMAGRMAAQGVLVP